MFLKKEKFLTFKLSFLKLIRLFVSLVDNVLSQPHVPWYDADGVGAVLLLVPKRIHA